MKYKTLLLLKPECYKWHIADDIITILKKKGYKIESQKEIIVDMNVMFLIYSFTMQQKPL